MQKSVEPLRVSKIIRSPRSLFTQKICSTTTSWRPDYFAHPKYDTSHNWWVSSKFGEGKKSVELLALGERKLRPLSCPEGLEPMRGGGSIDLPRQPFHEKQNGWVRTVCSPSHVTTHSVGPVTLPIFFHPFLFALSRLVFLFGS